MLCVKSFKRYLAFFTTVFLFSTIFTFLIGSTDSYGESNYPSPWRLVENDSESNLQRNVNDIYYFSSGVMLAGTGRSTGNMPGGSGVLYRKPANSSSAEVVLEDINAITAIHGPKDSNTAYIVGGYSAFGTGTTLMKTTDGGLNWTDLREPFVSQVGDMWYGTRRNTLLRGVLTLSEDQLYVTSGTRLYFSGNGGLNWTILNHAEDSREASNRGLLSSELQQHGSKIFLPTSDTLLVGSANSPSTPFQELDAPWTNVFNRETSAWTRNTLVSLHFSSESIGYALTEDSSNSPSSYRVYRTVNGGSSWSEVYSKASGFEDSEITVPKRDIYALSDNHLLSVGRGRVREALIESRDGGLSWSIIQDITSPLMGNSGWLKYAYLNDELRVYGRSSRTAGYYAGKYLVYTGDYSVSPSEPNYPDGVEAFDMGVRLEWNRANGIGYRLFRSTTANELGISVTDFYLTNTYHMDVNVEPNTTYYYSVKPVLREADPFQGVEESLGNTISTFTLTTGPDVGSTDGQNKNFLSLQLDNPLMNLNGELSEIDPGRGTVPVIISSRTMVPIRAIVESMDGDIAWNGVERKVTISARGNTLELWIGSNDIRVNGVIQRMDVAPVIQNDRTYLPIRFVTENLDAKVDWINSTREAVIVFE